jgi:tRNA modification GTPase
MDTSTIAAIATPSGRGGIGIIKISGAEAISIASRIFRSRETNFRFQNEVQSESPERSETRYPSHKLIYGQIVDPDDGHVLDEVLISLMKAPRTYTREDVVEINAHGGVVALQSILALVIKQGARLAEAGEFTKRAFINGRIDLTQAEAVIDVVNARTEKSLQIATAQMEGQLRKKIEAIRGVLINYMTHIEAAIDFPEEVEDLIDTQQVAAEVHEEVVHPLQKLIQKHFDARIFRDGLRVAVVGKPNVGKSSLLNRLVNKDRAIVTAIPGTTRDIIEETISIQGLPVILSDTAGLHNTNDPVETIGIEKTREHVNGSDLVLFLVDAHRALSDEDYEIYANVNTKPLIIAANKIDLVGKKQNNIIPDSWFQCEQVRISALYGQGVDTLKEKIFSLAFGKKPLDLDDAIVPNLRQKLAFERSLSAAEDIVSEMRNGTSIDLVAISTREAIDALDEILGINVKIDVLDQIFSQFCIGK